MSKDGCQRTEDRCQIPDVRRQIIECGLRSIEAYAPVGSWNVECGKEIR